MDGTYLPDAWSTAVPDWKDRIRNGRSLIPDLPLDEKRAARALDIFKSLRVPDLIGQPTFGEVGEPWIFDLVRAIFGAVDPVTRVRVLREFFVMVAKKNTKTTISAAIIVTACLLNEQPYHEFILIAPTINIAQHAYKQVKGIIAASTLSDGTALQPLFHTRDQLRQIELLNKALPSSIAIKAADTDIVTGFKNGSALVDELHELAAKSNAEAILLEITGAMASPENTGFLLTITTQSKGHRPGPSRPNWRLRATCATERSACRCCPCCSRCRPRTLPTTDGGIAAAGGWQTRTWGGRSTWRSWKPSLPRRTPRIQRRWRFSRRST